MSTAVAIRNSEELALGQRQPVTLIRPIAAPAEVLKAQEETRALIQEALQEGRDFGKIPGIDKPSLLKPGAERVALAFGCAIRFTIVEKEVDHDRVVTWVKKKKVFENRRYVRDDETTGTSLGLYRYVVECELVHRESGAVVGSCLGSCSSMESKYVDRPRDCENTIIKMAEKRAMVGATLTTFGLSEQFTQDVEDLPREQVGGSDESAPASEATPACPKCGGTMWDNRMSKRNPKAPDYKCRSRSCDGVVFPPRPGEEPTGVATPTAGHSTAAADVDEGRNLTLEQALEVPLPGGKNAWGGKGGTPIGQLSPKMLESVQRWVQGKIDEAGAEGNDADPVKAQLLAAVKLVLPFKRAEGEKDQASMNLETPAPAGSGGSVSMPRGGKVEDALGPQMGGAAPRPATAAVNPAPAPEGASAVAPAVATSGGAGSPTTNSKATSDGNTTRDEPPAISLSQLTRSITNLLKDKKLTDDERLQYRGQLEACTTLEQMDALNAQLVTYLDQPF